MEREGHGFKEMLDDEILDNSSVDNHDTNKPNRINKEKKDYEDSVPHFPSTIKKNEEVSGEKISRAKKNGREKINSLPLDLKLDKEVSALITEWKKEQGKNTKLLTGGLETAQFLHWILQEKEGAMSKKNYEKIYKLYDDETDPEIKSQAQESYIEEQEEKERKGEKIIEEPAPEEKPETKKNGREKINFLPLEVSLNTKFKPFITEWKQKQEKKTLLFSKTETAELLDWMLKEKATEISAKEYNTLQDVYLEMTTDSFPHTKETELKTQKKEQEEKDAQEINIVQEKIHRTIMNEANDINEIQTQLDLHRQDIKQKYGISFDQFNTPTTPADAEKIDRLLTLSENEPETKKTFWGKIKGLFQSSKDIQNAQNFKKDFEDYLRITKELPDKIQLKTTGGAIGRSMIGERGLVGTSVGNVETTRHTPIKREIPKRRGRPRKKTAS